MTNAPQVDGRALHAPTRIKESQQKGPDETPAFPDEIAHLKDIKGKTIWIPNGTWYSIVVKSTPTKCSKMNSL
jgi:hypothetical protein